VVDGHEVPLQARGEPLPRLRLLERNGEVRNIRRQVEYRLEVGGMLICKYRADFVYDELRKGEWTIDIVEDVKGYRTPEYRLKRKMMKVILGIEISET
jgi:hypothetical protein